MNKELIIEKSINYVKETLNNSSSSHDWWHIYRVWNLAKQISQNENSDLFIVELGALFHDIAEAKFYNGDETIGPIKAKEFLTSLNIENNIIDHVIKIIENISFKNTFNDSQNQFKSIELDIVQDADRLDGMGAIGIARTFTFSGYKGNPIHDPNIKPNLNKTKDEYKHADCTTINHFYEKLLLLKDKINTKTGKIMAEHRHRIMEEYLEEFYKEWEGRF
ncbi:HD domain-containing protein [Candidatus Woesearchaeota archaeon]|jgi:uncharacterized protein|nr:HD domain-containing protein [Candidatus Woesearchaeota archaeon]MBT4387029.1 HD domain-containing protein [Candidatus Woesearchaeota archaeon]MBT4595921.1 HD domain-containing protein [Candidatus Woesearchaeota archaeon]MBT5741051.1 HD domain-containing protein [Candidatus Woesearchaeota archaeon]MBT6505899.1 HD domain-containing protein [Candidatus Woesearchaeota archaeon]